MLRGTGDSGMTGTCSRGYDMLRECIIQCKVQALPCRISFIIKYSIWYIDYILNHRFVDNFKFSIADCNLDVENSIFF